MLLQELGDGTATLSLVTGSQPWACRIAGAPPAVLAPFWKHQDWKAEWLSFPWQTLLQNAPGLSLVPGPGTHGDHDVFISLGLSCSVVGHSQGHRLLHQALVRWLPRSFPTGTLWRRAGG